MAIKWTPSLAVGHTKIDEQHQELFRRLAALLEAMMKSDKSEVGRLFDFLASYVVEHFGTEEKLMQDHAFPGYQAHKAAHEKFVADYLALKKSLDATGGAGGAALTIKVQNWCADWLKQHIAGTDQALATFLASRAA
jgi:hemerythrin